MIHFLRVVPLAFLAAALLDAQPAAPKQPLPFSHKQHASTGMKCQECHSNADPGETMGFPPTSKCMACHREIAKDKPAIEKLLAYSQSGTPIPWVRVYQIPGYVKFSHRTHIDAGASCQICHGPVAQREVLWREGNIAMGACMNCHRTHKAGNECNLCHDPQ